MKNTLSNLSRSLMHFHKSLLEFQTRVVKTEDSRDYNPYEVLQMSLQDSRFQWLRKFSQLIIHTDIQSSEKVDPGTPDVPTISEELKNLLQDPEFLKHYNRALNANPALAGLKDQVQVALEKLQHHIH